MAGQGAKGGGQVAMPAAQAMGGSRGPMGPQGALGGPSIVMPNGMSSGDVNMGGNVSVSTGPIDTGLGAALGGPPLGGQPPSAEMIASDLGAGGLGKIDFGAGFSNNYFREGLPRVDNTNLANVPTMGGPNSIQTEAAIVGQRPRITDAMGNPQGSQMFGVAPPIYGTAEAGGVLGGTPAIGASGVLGPQQPAPSYNFTYDQAVGRQQQRDVKSPAEQAAINAAIAAGPSAGSQVGPQQPYPMSDIYQGPPLQQGPNELTAMLPPNAPMTRPNPNLPNQGLPMPSGGLKGGIFGQQPRPMPQPSQAQYAPLAPQGQFNVNQAAAGALQQAMGATQQGLGFTPMGIRPTAYRPSQIAGTSLAPYTNPYESQVVQQTMRDIGTAQEQALNLQGAQAQRAGAFGGSRQGIAEAETRLGYGQQALDAASRLRQQGYQTALGLAGQDVGAQTAAAQYAAQQRASAQAQNLAAQQAAMGMRLNAAQQLAGLGQQAFGTGQAIQQQQMQQGLLQQMLQQSLIDAAKAQYAGYTGAPSAALGAPLAALGASPVPQTTTQTKQPGLFDYLRLGATAYGMS